MFCSLIQATARHHSTSENELFMIRTLVRGILSAAALTGGAQAATLPIRHGDYVRDGVPCRDAPFAALMHYDGQSFSGPHASACTAMLLRRPGPRTYSLKSTCRAAGDGSPNGAYTEMQTIKVLSPSHIIFTHLTGAGVQDLAGYRACRAVDPT